MTLITIPLARQMLSDEMFYLYLTFKIWIFGVVPIIFIWFLKNERGENNFKKKNIECPFIETCDLNVSKEYYERYCRVETRLPQVTYQHCGKHDELMKQEEKKPSEWLKNSRGG
jgi:hypothetical protein